MPRGVPKYKQKEQYKANRVTDETLKEAGAEVIVCKGGAQYAKTDKAIWYKVFGGWRNLYSKNYNDLDKLWPSFKTLGTKKRKSKTK